MRIVRIDPEDDAAFDAWYDVLRATDEERWPAMAGWTRREVHALTSNKDASTECQCLSAIDESGATLGIGMLEVPQRDNRHSASLDVRVYPGHRRRGVGSAIVAEAERRAIGEGRSVLNAFVEVPTALLDTDSDSATAFAQRMGLEATQTANRRHLAVPIAAGLMVQLARLRDEVARASGSYRTFAFTAPWPKEYLDDQCELQRRMSTDAPSGDEHHEEETWDAERVEEMEQTLAAQGVTVLVVVAQHIGSGRLVGFSELALPQDHPHEAWQWATLVLREHRGHRLGLAVKLANLDNLAAVAPQVKLVITGNAQENAPMIAVNEMLGFEVVATSTFWQKELVP